MGNNQNFENASEGQTNVIDLTVKIKQRRDIQRASLDKNWQQTKVSFALSGIDLDENNAELAGRLLSGEITLEQALEEVKRQHGLTPSGDKPE